MLYNEKFSAKLAVTSRDFSIIKSAFQTYNYSEWGSVTEAYGKPSENKIFIDNYWQSFCKQIGGKFYRIVNRSYFTFTCGFLCRDENDELCFIYVLPSRVIYAPVSDIKAALK